jgi:hypothetical protein
MEITDEIAFCASWENSEYWKIDRALARMVPSPLLARAQQDLRPEGAEIAQPRVLTLGPTRKSVALKGLEIEPVADGDGWIARWVCVVTPFLLAPL